MKTLLTILLLVGSALCQTNLPDAPSSQKNGVNSYPDYSEHLTWKQTFTSKRFLIAEGAMAASMTFEDYFKVRAMNRCPWLQEKNQFWWVGPNATPTQMVTRDLALFGIVSGVNIVASKYLSPWISFGPASAFSARYLQGGVQWKNACP